MKNKYDEFIEYLKRGNEYEAIYKGITYFIGSWEQYCILNNELGELCGFDELDDFKDKANIQGELLKDNFDQLLFINCSDGDF